MPPLPSFALPECVRAAVGVTLACAWAVPVCLQLARSEEALVEAERQRLECTSAKAAVEAELASAKLATAEALEKLGAAEKAVSDNQVRAVLPP
jgi:hypothetical protein